MSVGLVRAPRPQRASTAATQLVLIAGLLLFLGAWLALLGRPLICSCGTVRLFVADASSTENSQQFADFYSGLHVIFGLGLWVFLDWMKPHWSVGQKLIVAVASSVAWEAIENIPFIVAVFNSAPGSPAYTGDSILNALADTLFVVAGFIVARWLPPVGTGLVGLALEIAVSLAVNDGLVLGTLRILGVPI